MSFIKDKYSFVGHNIKDTSIREIIAIGKYCGKAVKGTAKCDPRDEFDAETGETLAALRCNQKIATLRVNRAIEKQNAAVDVFNKAEDDLAKAKETLDYAVKELYEAEKLLNEFLEKI